MPKIESDDPCVCGHILEQHSMRGCGAKRCGCKEFLDVHSLETYVGELTGEQIDRLYTYRAMKLLMTPDRARTTVSAESFASISEQIREEP